MVSTKNDCHKTTWPCLKRKEKTLNYACLEVCLCEDQNECVCVWMCVHANTCTRSLRVSMPEWTKGDCCILYNVNAFIHMTIYEEVCKGNFFVCVCACVFFFVVFFFPHSVADTPGVLQLFLYFMYEMLIIVS